MSLRYLNCCVNWPSGDVSAPGGLNDMIEASIDVTRRTFLKHVDKDDLRFLGAALSYEPHPKLGLTMAGDWAVSYHRSKLHGKTVYYFRHSAIEHVFA